MLRSFFCAHILSVVECYICPQNMGLEEYSVLKFWAWSGGSVPDILIILIDSEHGEIFSSKILSTGEFSVLRFWPWRNFQHLDSEPGGVFFGKIAVCSEKTLSLCDCIDSKHEEIFCAKILNTYGRMFCAKILNTYNGRFSLRRFWIPMEECSLLRF